MRVIAGQFRGKRLLAPEGRGTRPTSEKVRESIFDILCSRGHTSGAVLDLFAGTGALGIEAISRGAESAVFVEKDPEAAAIARKNLASLGIRERVYNTDWKVAVRKLAGRKFDVIFLDPPYAQREESRLLKAISDNDLLADGGCIVVEHAADSYFDHAGYESDRRKYSDTGVTFLHRSHKKPLCIFPGTFDPFTRGHSDVVNKALDDFDAVIVAVAELTYKEGTAATDKRVRIAELSLQNTERVTIESFSGMLTDYAERKNCFELVRGIRNDEDRAHEAAIAEIYLKAQPRINITYYDADEPMISSHAVREMIRSCETEALADFVCPGAFKDIIDIYG